MATRGLGTGGISHRRMQWQNWPSWDDTLHHAKRMHRLSACQNLPCRKPAWPREMLSLSRNPTLASHSGVSPKTKWRKCRNKLHLLHGSTETHSFLNSGLKILFLFSQHFQGSPAKIPSSSQSLTSWLSAALILSTVAKVEKQYTPLLSQHCDYWCKAATLLQCSEHQSLTHHSTSPGIIHCTDPR